MKFKIFFLFLFILIFSSTVFPYSPDTIKLYEGKNFVNFNVSQEFYASSLINFNPQVESISYIKNNITHGYVSFLGGMGENFLIQSEEIYEVILSENATIILP